MTAHVRLLILVPLQLLFPKIMEMVVAVFSFPVTQGQVSVDPPTPLHMRLVVGVVQAKALERAEV